MSNPAPKPAADGVVATQGAADGAVGAGTAHLLRADLGARLGWCWALCVNWHRHGWDYGGVRPIAPAVDPCPVVLADLALGFAFAAQRISPWSTDGDEHVAEVDAA